MTQILIPHHPRPFRYPHPHSPDSSHALSSLLFFPLDLEYPNYGTQAKKFFPECVRVFRMMNLDQLTTNPKISMGGNVVIAAV